MLIDIVYFLLYDVLFLRIIFNNRILEEIGINDEEIYN